MPAKASDDLALTISGTVCQGLTGKSSRASCLSLNNGFLLLKRVLEQPIGALPSQPDAFLYVSRIPHHDAATGCKRHAASVATST